MLLSHCDHGKQERTDCVCNRSHASNLMQRMLPRLLVLPGALETCIAQTIELLKDNLVRLMKADLGRSRPI